MYEDYDDYCLSDLSYKDLGFVHQDDLPDLTYCKEMVEQLIEAVYYTGSIDRMEDAIDELSLIFEARMPQFLRPRLRSDKKKSACMQEAQKHVI